MVSLFIFRRDLRLYDNIGLINALRDSQIVIPIFIFTPDQLSRNNVYKSDKCVRFMIESLEKLDHELRKRGSRLFYFYGDPHIIVSSLLKKNSLDISSVFVNRDYTPYSIRRDDLIRKTCERLDVQYRAYEDYLLYPVGHITTGSGDIYTKFTPYFKKAVRTVVQKELTNNYSNYYPKSKKLIGEYTSNLTKFYNDAESENSIRKGGRSEGLIALKESHTQTNYNTNRNSLNYPTTRLSAYLKFGCLSIRETYYFFVKKLSRKNDLIKQLYWREFYTNLVWKYPNVLDGPSKNFSSKYNKVKWTTWENASKKQKVAYQKWTTGTTGIPVIDAAMRELNLTGFMHNRGRLIVASFLTKQMFWHWIEGEKYFAQKLYDYCPILNNSNWQFCSGSGADVQPYFRVFNPWLQGFNHDYECEYIKKWVPELKQVANTHIHQWYAFYKNYQVDYPKPMLDNRKLAEKAKRKFGHYLYGNEK